MDKNVPAAAQRCEKKSLVVAIATSNPAVHGGGSDDPVKSLRVAALSFASCLSKTLTGMAASLTMAASALALPAGAVAAGEAACDAARTALQSMSAAQRQRFTLTESSCAPSTTATELSVPSAPSTPTTPAAARESMHLQLFQGQGASVLGRQTHRSVASVAQWSGSGATLRAATPRMASAHTSRAVQLAPEIDAVARRHNIDPLLMHAIAHVESRHNPQARSHAGALGVMQVMPTTGQRFGVAHRASLHHAPTNLEVSATYLKVLQERFGNNLQLVLAAYNAGEGAVEKYGRRIPPYAETQRYVVAVMATYQSLSATARQVRGKPPAPRAAAASITAM
jgi:soluble lytic murein transglycosylase-like protein